MPTFPFLLICFTKWCLLYLHSFFGCYLSSIFKVHSKLNFTFFFYISVFVTKYFPTLLSSSWGVFKGVLQCFWLIVSFFPVIPAVNKYQNLFSLHTVYARYTVSTQLICVDNKWRNKGSFNTGEEIKPVLCLMTCFLQG